MDKKKVLLGAIPCIAVCASMIVGSTYALFTSEDSVNISVTTGNVDVVATLDDTNAQTKQLGVDYQPGLTNTYGYTGEENVEIDKGNGTVTISNFVPGDGVKFEIVVENNSSVKVLYKTNSYVTGDEELSAALRVSIANGQDTWTEFEVGEEAKRVSVEIELPEETKSFSSDVEEHTVSIQFAVTAIQGNADVFDDNAITLKGGLNGKYGTLAEAIEKINEDAGTDTIKMLLGAGTYDIGGASARARTATANELAKITRDNVEIIGADMDTTVINVGESSVSGQAGLLISGDNVTLKNLTIVSNSANGDVAGLKVTKVGESDTATQELVKNVKLENIKAYSLSGHAFNFHGVENAVVENCVAASYAKCGIAIANTPDIKISGTQFTNADAWGDIGFMYGNSAAYVNPSNLTLGAGNSFAAKFIYSERPSSANGGADTISGYEQYDYFKKLDAENGAWALNCYVWDGTTVSTKWYNKNDTTFTIVSAAQFAGFAKLVNDGEKFSGKTVNLGIDIDLNNKEWTPIGVNADNENKFYGTFDGNNLTISNLTVDTTQEALYRASGLFGALNGRIQNLNVKGANVKGLSAPNSDGNTDNGIAIVAGSIYNSGSIENVTVEDSYVSGNRYVAGIAGYVYGNVDNCTVLNTTITATPDKLNGSWDNGDKVGGIVAYLNDDTHTLTGNTVRGCNISAWRDVGGIGGCVGVGTHADVKNNTVSGNTITYVENTEYTRVHENMGDIIGRNMSGIALDGSNIVEVSGN